MPSLPRTWASRLAALFLLTAVYIAAGKLGLALAFVHTNASPVWPPTGIALAAFLLFGPRVWPAIFVGAYVVNVTTAGTSTTSAAIAVGNTLEGLVGSFLARRFAAGELAFEWPRDIVRFVALSAGVATMVSATIGVASLALGGFARWSDFGAIWLTWWLGDAMGAVVVTPLLVLLRTEPWRRWSPRKLVEAILLIGGLSATVL